MKITKKMLTIIIIILCTALASPSYAPLTIQASAATTQKIKINKKNVTLKSGKTVKLKLKNTTEKPTWKSSNKKIATVNKSGKVTAKKKGTATITAKLNSKTYKCKITVKAKSTKPKKTATGNTENEKTDTAASDTNTSNEKNEVWITATGKKYHNKFNCGNTDPSRARKISLTKAKEAGYEPCSRCW